jgi:hypothetical protein
VSLRRVKGLELRHVALESGDVARSNGVEGPDL